MFTTQDQPHMEKTFHWTSTVYNHVLLQEPNGKP